MSLRVSVGRDLPVGPSLHVDVSLSLDGDVDVHLRPRLCRRVGLSLGLSLNLHLNLP